jgi:hypothetical protein
MFYKHAVGNGLYLVVTFLLPDQFAFGSYFPFLCLPRNRIYITYIT